MDVVSSTYIPKYVRTPFCENDIENTEKSDSFANKSRKGIDITVNRMPSFETSLSKSDGKEIEIGKADVINLTKANFSGIKEEINRGIEEREKLNLPNPDGKYTDYYNFDNFIDGISGLSKKEVCTVKNAVLTATEAERNSRFDDTYSMTVAQTNFELKYISKNLIPEKYQEGFNSIIKNYTNDSFKRMKNYLEDFAKSMINTKDSRLIAIGWVQQGNDLLKSAQDGTDSMQTSTRTCEGLYNNIENSNSQNIKQNLESVYDYYIESKINHENDTMPQKILISNVMGLKEQWNSVICAIEGNKSLMFKTSVNGLV